MTWWGCQSRDIQGADRGASSGFSVCQTEFCWQVELPEINDHRQSGGGENPGTQVPLGCVDKAGLKEKSLL